MGDRVAALARKAKTLEAEIGADDRHAEDTNRRLDELTDLLRLKQELDETDGGPTAAQLAREEKALRLLEIRQRMRHAEERQKAFLEAARRASEPLTVLRDETGAITGAQ